MFESSRLQMSMYKVNGCILKNSGTWLKCVVVRRKEIKIRIAELCHARAKKKRKNEHKTI